MAAADPTWGIAGDSRPGRMGPLMAGAFGGRNTAILRVLMIRVWGKVSKLADCRVGDKGTLMAGGKSGAVRF